MNQAPSLRMGTPRFALRKLGRIANPDQFDPVLLFWVLRFLVVGKIG